MQLLAQTNLKKINIQNYVSSLILPITCSAASLSTGQANSSIMFFSKPLSWYSVPVLSSVSVQLSHLTDARQIVLTLIEPGKSTKNKSLFTAAACGSSQLSLSPRASTGISPCRLGSGNIRTVILGASFFKQLP